MKKKIFQFRARNTDRYQRKNKILFDFDHFRSHIIALPYQLNPVTTSDPNDKVGKTNFDRQQFFWHKDKIENKK